MTSRVLKGALLAGLALAVVAASAQAGGYHVYTCRTPVGESAPTDGWVGTAAGASVYAEDTCRQGGASIAQLAPEHSLHLGDGDCRRRYLNLAEMFDVIGPQQIRPPA